MINDGWLLKLITGSFFALRCKTWRRIAYGMINDGWLLKLVAGGYLGQRC